jgi:hypothetical protein
MRPTGWEVRFSYYQRMVRSIMAMLEDAQNLMKVDDMDDAIRSRPAAEPPCGAPAARRRTGHPPLPCGAPRATNLEERRANLAHADAVGLRVPTRIRAMLERGPP